MWYYDFCSYIFSFVWSGTLEANSSPQCATVIYKDRDQPDTIRGGHEQHRSYRHGGPTETKISIKALEPKKMKTQR